MNKKVVVEMLDDALRNGHLNPLKYEFLDTEIKGGYVAKLKHVIISVDKQGTEEVLDVIVKSTSGGIYLDACLNETNFYTEIIPHFNELAEERKATKFSHLPLCYGISTSDNHVTVVLENLIAKGFKVHSLEPYDSDHIEILLQAFAESHAFSFALGDQKPEIFRQLGKRNVKLSNWKVAEVVTLSFEEQLEYLIGVYEERNKPDILNKLKSLKNNFRTLTDEFLTNKDEDYVVVTHSDVWNNNFLFKYNGGSKPSDVKIIDWQTSVVGSPLIDIVQLFFLSCTRNELDHIDEYLSIYYNTLSNKIRQLGSNPEKCFPHEACLKAFKRYAPLGIAGMPFAFRMYFNKKNIEDTYGSAETSDGNLSAILGDVSDMGKFFQSVDAILELCVERYLI